MHKLAHLCMQNFNNHIHDQLLIIFLQIINLHRKVSDQHTKLLLMIQTKLKPVIQTKTSIYLMYKQVKIIVFKILTQKLKVYVSCINFLQQSTIKYCYYKIIKELKFKKELAI